MTTPEHEHDHRLHTADYIKGFDLFYCTRCLEYTWVDREEQPAVKMLAERSRAQGHDVGAGSVTQNPDVLKDAAGRYR